MYHFILSFIMKKSSVHRMINTNNDMNKVKGINIFKLNKKFLNLFDKMIEVGLAHTSTLSAINHIQDLTKSKGFEF